MDHDDGCFLSLLVFTFFAGCITGAGAASSLNTWAMRKDAIEARVARWEVDPETGQTRFVYLTPGAEK